MVPLYHLCNRAGLLLVVLFVVDCLLWRKLLPGSSARNSVHDHVVQCLHFWLLLLFAAATCWLRYLMLSWFCFPLGARGYFQACFGEALPAPLGWLLRSRYVNWRCWQWPIAVLVLPVGVLLFLVCWPHCTCSGCWIHCASCSGWDATLSRAASVTGRSTNLCCMRIGAIYGLMRPTLTPSFCLGNCNSTTPLSKTFRIG